VLETSRKRVQR